jgi:hypothetical protein
MGTPNEFCFVTNKSENSAGADSWKLYTPVIPLIQPSLGQVE